MKRFLATLAVLSMTAVLAACTQQKEEPVADEAAADTAVEVVEPAAEDAAMEATEEAPMEATEDAAMEEEAAE